MTKYEIMDNLTSQHKGYLLTAEVQENGISRTYLSKYVKERNMERVEAGIYILPEVWPDPLYILQMKNKETIFSNETALYLHGLMEHEPKKICVSVKRGYNASHLIKRGIKPYYIRQEVFDQGTSFVKTTYGNEVRTYDIDRTICDMVLRKNDMDIQIFQGAIREYMAGNEKNIHRLMTYAKLLGLEKKVTEYAEVLL